MSCFAVNAACAFCERLSSVRTDILVGAVDNVILMMSSSNQLHIVFGVSCASCYIFFFICDVVMKRVLLSVLVTVGDLCCVPIFFFGAYLLEVVCVVVGVSVSCIPHAFIAGAARCILVCLPESSAFLFCLPLEGMGRLSCVKGQSRNNKKEKN